MRKSPPSPCEREKERRRERERERERNGFSLSHFLASPFFLDLFK
jgi:hypothetical protein